MFRSSYTNITPFFILAELQRGSLPEMEQNRSDPGFYTFYPLSSCFCGLLNVLHFYCFNNLFVVIPLLTKKESLSKSSIGFWWIPVKNCIPKYI